MNVRTLKSGDLYGPRLARLKEDEPKQYLVHCTRFGDPRGKWVTIDKANATASELDVGVRE